MPDTEQIDFDSLYQELESGKYDIVCVVGPTASGKTRYAVELAKRMNSLRGEACAEILSADSRQVYKGMDIGTGKDINEYEDIPYHLIDIVNAGERYTVYDYQKDFEKAYGEIKSRNGIPVLCGGSGLYVSAAVNAYSLADVPPNPELRESLEQEDVEELREKLAELKPTGDLSVFDSKKRLIRALEIAFYEQDNKVNKSAFKKKKAFYIGLAVSTEERNALIDRRLDRRIEEGMVDEVRRLLDEGVPAETLSYYGLEYKFITNYILGITDLETMRRMLADAIHRLAKRQMTWLRDMEREGVVIHWTCPES